MPITRQRLLRPMSGLLLATIVACAQAQGTLRIGITASDVPTTTGTPNGGFEGVRFLGYTAFEGLVLWDLSKPGAPADIRPGLAERWTQDPNDPATWIFHLRRGVKFHDGSDFNADAVIWNLDRYFEPTSKQYDPQGSALVRSRSTALKSWRKIDDYTVAITTPRPLGYFPYFASYILFSSPAQYEKTGSWAEFAKSPSGTGPFRIKTVTPRTSAELERFPGYWDPARRAKLDRLVIMPIPDSNTRVAALRSGQVDWIETPAPDAVDSLKQAGYQITTGTYPHLWPWSFDVASPNAPFRDVRVRQAMNYCIDRQAIVKLLNGLVEPASGFFAASNPLFGKPANRYAYDPAKAAALMTAAGYGPGKRIAAKILISSSGSGQLIPVPMNEVLQQQLAKCNIDVTFDVVEWNALLVAFRGGPSAPQSMGVAALNNSLPTSDISQLARYLASSNAAPAGANWGGWKNAQFDAAITRAETSGDPAVIRAAATAAHEAAVDDPPFLYVVHDLNGRAMTKKVKGFASAQSWFQDLTPVSVDP